MIKHTAISGIALSIAVLAQANPTLIDTHTRQNIIDKPNTIIFVWDGLRPDSVTQIATPNLFHLAHHGVWFNDNHSSYPTFTMMNASSFATGDFAGKTGFYGNTLWQNKAKGKDSSNKEIDFQQPVFTEDYRILEDLDRVSEAPLIEVTTLFKKAQQAGFKTAAVGKSGAAFMQDYKSKGIIFDEKHVFPESFAKYLNNKNYPLPADTKYSYKDFKINSKEDPTSYGDISTLEDGVTTNPVTGVKSPYNKNNSYLMKSYLNEVIPRFNPQLSVVWLRNPDTTEHNYGVGSKAYFNALKNQDYLLGLLIEKLKKDGKWSKTNLIILSDHGHSNVSGPLNDFPLRNINVKNNSISNIDNINGFSVSGDFRPADLLSKAGFTAFDGVGCEYDPILTGIYKDSKPVYPTKYDTTGKICGGEVRVVDQNGHREANLSKKYTTPAYMVPKKLTKNSIIVAANGGSTYLYVPSHDKVLVEKIVKFLQSREEFGVIFVDSSRYGNIPGTLALKTVKLENSSKRNPDIIVGSNFDASARIQGYSGTEFNSSGSDRGMHGSFSPIDVHNTLIAYGPSFKKHFIDQYPTGNVDLAPTIAHILGLNLGDTDGRVLLEALKGQKVHYKIEPHQISTTTVDGLLLKSAKDPNGKINIPGKSKYKSILSIKSLETGDNTYQYFDSARTIRF